VKKMKELSFLFVIVVLVGISSGEVGLADLCSASKQCINCTSIPGCNWCAAGMRTSFCTHLNAKQAECDMSACATDTFMMKPSECFGGCPAALECSSCHSFIGCNWCFKKNNGQSGCLDLPNANNNGMKETKNIDPMQNMSNSDCVIWDARDGTCSVPCELRRTCKQCLTVTAKSNCSWCPIDQYSGNCYSMDHMKMNESKVGESCLVGQCPRIQDNSYLYNKKSSSLQLLVHLGGVILALLATTLA